LKPPCLIAESPEVDRKVSFLGHRSAKIAANRHRVAMAGLWSLHVLHLIVQLVEFRGIAGNSALVTATYCFGPRAVGGRLTPSSNACDESHCRNP
jgi:hypothetical protein